jgi:hypothetical protein
MKSLQDYEVVALTSGSLLEAGIFGLPSAMELG